MNLTIDPWIPIVWDDGNPGLVSLSEAFSRGHEIYDLAMRPHERIALMRLLICVAQAALDGPADYDDWKICQPRIVPAVLAYLGRWQLAFELFGSGPRFLQAKSKGSPGMMELDKLDFIDADMTTLFDQDVVLRRVREISWIALRLVTYQSFAAGGMVGGAAQVGGRFRPQTGKNGPCRDRSAFHAFIRRANLLATLHSNLVTKEVIARFHNLRWGQPVWELKAKELSKLETDGAIVRSYLGRLAPLSRAIWLNSDAATALNANGLQYPNFSEEGIRDSTTSVRVDRDGQQHRVLLSAVDGDNIKRPWRELHALTVKRINDEGVGGPLALINLSDDTSFDLWVGAMVTGRAKIEDTVESTHSIPAGLLYETVQRAYELGVRHAEDWEWRLRRAISTYRLAIETNEDSFQSLQRRFGKLKKSERQRLIDISSKALSSFWTLVEQRLDLLNRFATEPVPTKNGKPAYSETNWGNCVQRVARTSYGIACSHETARQIRAYALGRQTLFATPANRQPGKETKL